MITQGQYRLNPYKVRCIKFDNLLFVGEERGVATRERTIASACTTLEVTEALLIVVLKTEHYGGKSHGIIVEYTILFM